MINHAFMSWQQYIQMFDKFILIPDFVPIDWAIYVEDDHTYCYFWLIYEHFDLQSIHKIFEMVNCVRILFVSIPFLIKHFKKKISYKSILLDNLFSLYLTFWIFWANWGQCFSLTKWEFSLKNTQNKNLILNRFVLCVNTIRITFSVQFQFFFISISSFFRGNSILSGSHWDFVLSTSRQNFSSNWFDFDCFLFFFLLLLLLLRFIDFINFICVSFCDTLYTSVMDPFFHLPTEKKGFSSISLYTCIQFDLIRCSLHKRKTLNQKRKMEFSMSLYICSIKRYFCEYLCFAAIFNGSKAFSSRKNRSIEFLFILSL